MTSMVTVLVELEMVTGAGEEMEVAAVGERETIKMVTIAMSYNMDWSLSSPALENTEVAFNKIIRRIWRLSPRSHSRIVHLVANLQSLFNVIYRRSKSLLFAATQCPSLPYTDLHEMGWFQAHTGKCNFCTVEKNTFLGSPYP